MPGNEVPYVAMPEGDWGVMHAGAGLKRKAAEQLSGPTASIRRMETALKGISQVMGTALRDALLTICIPCSRAGHCVCLSVHLCIQILHMSTFQVAYSPVTLASVYRLNCRPRVSITM